MDRNAARHLVMSTLRVIERSSTRGDRSEDRVEGYCADRKGKIADEMQFPGLPHRGYNAQGRTVRSTWLSASSTAAQNLQCFHVAPCRSTSPRASALANFPAMLTESCRGHQVGSSRASCWEKWMPCCLCVLGRRSGYPWTPLNNL